MELVPRFNAAYVIDFLLFYRTAPTLVFLLMLACRLVVDWQMSGKVDGDDDDENELDAPTSSTDSTEDKLMRSTRSKTKAKAKKEN